jgi:hypothetical protein
LHKGPVSANNWPPSTKTTTANHTQSSCLLTHLINPLIHFLQVDYKEKELVFKVGIGGTEPTTDMRALSGGERSLASLAFILALGEAGTAAHAVQGRAGSRIKREGVGRT